MVLKKISNNDNDGNDKLVKILMKNFLDLLVKSVIEEET